MHPPWQSSFLPAVGECLPSCWALRSPWSPWVLPKVTRSSWARSAREGVLLEATSHSGWSWVPPQEAPHPPGLLVSTGFSYSAESSWQICLAVLL